MGTMMGRQRGRFVCQLFLVGRFTGGYRIGPAGERPFKIEPSDFGVTEYESQSRLPPRIACAASSAVSSLWALAIVASVRRSPTISDRSPSNSRPSGTPRFLLHADCVRPEQNGSLKRTPQLEKAPRNNQVTVQNPWSDHRTLLS